MLLVVHQLDRKTLLLKTPSTLVIGHGELKLVLTRKLALTGETFQPASIEGSFLEGATMQVAGGMVIIGLMQRCLL